MSGERDVRASAASRECAGTRSPAGPSAWAVPALILLILVSALVTYKTSGSLATIARVETSRTLPPRAETISTADLTGVLRPLARTANYLAVVWPALAFGVLIGAAVRAIVPSAWVRRAFDASPLRAQLLGGVAGAPLMLCSCCIAPVFAAVHERTRRAGPSGALLLASPSLNPAALALTFMLFVPRVALVRTGMALLLVFGVSALAARLAAGGRSAVTPCDLEVAPRVGAAGVLSSLLREGWRMAWTTLPAIAAGVVVSSVLAEALPMERLQEVPFRIASVIVVALVSVPLALPTFAEIPLALGLLAAGAPAGAAVALLIAGPAINAPSLLTVGRTTSPRYALALAAGTAVVAVGGGLLV